MTSEPIFDAHLHIIAAGFPLVANQGYLPPAFDCAAYRARSEPLGICAGAVVSGSFQAFDQSYLLAALRQLGPRFVGVTQLPATVSDAEILRLDRAGVRGLRFNLKRGGSAGIDELDRLARRVHEIAGWHCELYCASAELAPLFDLLSALPAVSIDHLGLTATGFDVLLRLAERGVRVKATGFGRVDFPVAPALRQLHAANPAALLFGTDLPGTRTPRPFQTTDLQQIRQTLGPVGARQVLYENARAFYRLDAAAAMRRNDEQNSHSH